MAKKRKRRSSRSSEPAVASTEETREFSPDDSAGAGPDIVDATGWDEPSPTDGGRADLDADSEVRHFFEGADSEAASGGDGAKYDDLEAEVQANAVFDLELDVSGLSALTVDSEMGGATGFPTLKGQSSVGPDSVGSFGGPLASAREHGTVAVGTPGEALADEDQRTIESSDPELIAALTGEFPRAQTPTKSQEALAAAARSTMPESEIGDQPDWGSADTGGAIVVPDAVPRGEPEAAEGGVGSGDEWDGDDAPTPVPAATDAVAPSEEGDVGAVAGDAGAVAGDAGRHIQSSGWSQAAEAVPNVIAANAADFDLDLPKGASGSFESPTNHDPRDDFFRQPDASGQNLADTAEAIPLDQMPREAFPSYYEDGDESEDVTPPAESAADAADASAEEVASDQAEGAVAEPADGVVPDEEAVPVAAEVAAEEEPVAEEASAEETSSEEESASADEPVAEEVAPEKSQGTETPSAEGAPAAAAEVGLFPGDGVEEADNARDTVPGAKGIAEEFERQYAQNVEASIEVAADLVAATGSREQRRSIETPFGLETLPPSITLPEIEGGLPDGEFTWTNQFDLFRAEVQKLARAKRWRRLAAVTAHAVVNAPYSKGGTRTSMLLDLARIYRDRLKDGALAEEAFVAAAREEPENAEAIGFLTERYGELGDHRAIYDLYLAAVDSTWDPVDRLAWTEACSVIALERLRDVALAIRAWEQLWRLGDGADEATRELARLYRLARSWKELGTFLEVQVEHTDGPAHTVLLRELAEVELAGNTDPVAGSAILQRIVDTRPDDPLGTIQLARIYSANAEWAALERLGHLDASGTVSVDAVLERQHLVAGALWDSGRMEQAAQIYRLVLDSVTDDPLALDRYRAWLRGAGRHDELVDALLQRVEATADEGERSALLADAAAVAEVDLGDAARAIQLHERRLNVEGDDVDTCEALARLYEKVEDDKGLARALDGLYRLHEEPEARLSILRRVARHYTERVEDHERAEAAWSELLSIDATDTEAREQLMDLYRLRGDFEALNSALLRQISLTRDPGRAEALCRRAAQNLDENFDDSERSIEAWRRVLDYAPDDGDSLRALTEHYARSGDRRHQIAVLERRILRETEEGKVDLGLQVAGLWAETGEHRAAAAAFERILHWNRGNATAIDGLVDVYVGADRPDLAIDAFEQMLGGAESVEERIVLLRRVLALVPAEDHRGRFDRLRRALLFSAGDPAELLVELEAEAEAGDLWEDFAAILAGLHAYTEDAEQRTAYRCRLAEIFEIRLEDPIRAYAVQHAALWSGADGDDALAELRRLAPATGRHEDLVALLGTRTLAGFEMDVRRSHHSERAAISEEFIESPRRALLELRRLIELDPTDWDPVDEIWRLAEANGLWADADLTLAEIADRSHTDDERLQLAARRELIFRTHTEDLATAFRHVVARFRIAPGDAETASALAEDADTLEAWDWTLPVLEAARLASIADGDASDLAEVARLYADKLGDPDRAFDLYLLAFAVSPGDAELPDRLGELVEETGRYPEYAQALRRAAAGGADEELGVSLLRRTAAVYEDKLDLATDAVEVHRRLLELKDDELPSLEVMIASHRERGQWHDLRDRLSRWVDVAPEDTDRAARWLEIAELSEERLDDVHRALEGFSKVLELSPDHDQARGRLDAIVRRLDDAELQLRFHRLELERAGPDDRTEIQLHIARLQLDRLDDTPGAIETLQALAEEAGVDSPAFAPLADLYRSEERNRELVLLLLDRALATENVADKKQLLRQCLDAAVRTDDLSVDERERVYRAILEHEIDDVVVRRQYAQLLRSRDRFEELSALLEETAECVSDAVERTEVRKERARLLQLNLDKPDEGLEIWRAFADDGDDESALLALAQAARDAGDMEGYIAFRERQARLAVPEEAALVLCHLAEACEESEDLQGRMVEFYREARKLHPACEPAMEALKGIGRRKKTLRPDAALLPEAGERDLDWSSRGRRLCELGESLMDSDVRGALGYFRRAVATYPDDAGSWDGLAAAAERLGESASTHRARVAALEALRRTTPVDAETIDAEAERLLAIADRARADGPEGEYERLIRRVFHVAPTHAPTAVAVADMLIASDENADAFYLLDSLATRHRARIPDELVGDVFYARGRTQRALGRIDEAVADFRRALTERPLFSEALTDLATAEAEGGNYAAALEHQIRALVVKEDPRDRADVFFRLGVLWEDGLTEHAEAGACYELARSEGLASRDLLLRVFSHFKRTGQLEQGLDVVDTLLESAEEPAELATLWLARGEIFAGHDGREDEAIEAFDMALSYDPDRHEARAALAAVLERRGDWEQLLQILEAISDSSAADLRADALVRMAGISVSQLDDPDRAEGYLRESLEAAPGRDALQLLAEIAAQREPGGVDHSDLLGRLVAFGPPWYEYCLALGQLSLDAFPRYGWCLLAPALMIRSSDDDLKGRLRDMRRDFERPPILTPSEEGRVLLAPDADLATVEGVLAELDAVVSIGQSSLDAMGGDLTNVSVHSNIGRTFASFAESVGMAEASLYRVTDLDEPLRIVATEDGPAVIIRSEVFQQMARAEVGFVLAYAMELARLGNRGLASLPRDSRSALLPGLWAALEFTDSPGRQASKIAERIVEETTEEQRDAWAEALAALSDEDPNELGGRYWAEVRGRAARLGLLGGADIFQAIRLYGRMGEDLERPGVFNDTDEFDRYITASEVVVDLVRFAATPDFAALIDTAIEVG